MKSRKRPSIDSLIINSQTLFADSVGNQTGTVDLSGKIGDGAVRVSVTSDVLDWTKTNTCGGHSDGDFRQRHDL